MDADAVLRRAAQIAGADQVAAGLADFAACLAQYHRALQLAGFTDSEALFLTAQYQASILALLHKPGDR